MLPSKFNYPLVSYEGISPFSYGIKLKSLCEVIKSPRAFNGWNVNYPHPKLVWATLIGRNHSHFASLSNEGSCNKLYNRGRSVRRVLRYFDLIRIIPVRLKDQLLPITALTPDLKVAVRCVQNEKEIFLQCDNNASLYGRYLAWRFTRVQLRLQLHPWW